MKVLVVGYGSIGKRHADILTLLNHDVAIVTRRCQEGGRFYQDLERTLAEWSPGYVVVASRTNEHLDDIKTLADCGFQGTVMVEKPVFDQINIIPDHNFKNLYVGYNLRLHPAVQLFRKIISETVIHAVHAYVGQYLQDWRPGADYRLSNSANRASGGGVLRDLSHEFDYLIWILGSWRELTATGGHFSELDIDSDDVFSILMKTERCPLVSIHMNYLDHLARREVLAHTNKGTIHLDLISGSVRWQRETRVMPVNKDDTYRWEHECALSGDQTTLCTAAEGLDIVSTICASEEAARNLTWVCR